jgi:NADH dehydrogenase
MIRADNHKLVNLTVAQKLARSFGLLVGLFLFFSASFFGVLLTNWQFSIADAIGWGGMLRTLHRNNEPFFYALFGAHAASLVLILALTTALFRKVALPRGGRIALTGVTVALGLLDLFCWVLLPYAEAAGTALGAVIALESLSLLYLMGRPLHDMWIYTRWRKPDGNKVRVVIVGGGFAGLYAAIGLDGRLGYHEDLEITVIDRRNYFLFPPLLPSVAAGAIETRQVTYPFRRIFEATNVIFKKEHVERIDIEERRVISRVDVESDPVTKQTRVITSETLYDYLVLAPGSDTNTLGTKGVAEHAFFMRELGDAIAVRNHLIDCFEHAAREIMPDKRKELLSFVIVGAGPTGVELASEVRDLIAHVLLRRYPEIDPFDVSVYVVQSGDQILPGWSDSVVREASTQLGKMQIDVLLRERVVAVDASSVTLSSGRVITARTCVWCAGVKPAGILRAVALPKDRSGRIEIEPDLRVKGRERELVLGDAAFLMHEGKPLPPLGQVAFQQGSHAAANIVRLIRGKPPSPFKYFNFGSLVSVGEHFAAIDLLGVKTSGLLAWLIWRTLYLSKLVGFGNKVRVVLDWTLDLLVERSISQISATRQELQVEEAAEREAEREKAVHAA